MLVLISRRNLVLLRLYGTNHTRSPRRCSTATGSEALEPPTLVVSALVHSTTAILQLRVNTALYWPVRAFAAPLGCRRRL